MSVLAGKIVMSTVRRRDPQAAARVLQAHLARTEHSALAALPAG